MTRTIAFSRPIQHGKAVATLCMKMFSEGALNDPFGDQEYFVTFNGFIADINPTPSASLRPNEDGTRRCNIYTAILS